ncbi:hypothetical protein, partial [Allomuricauda sp. CP2A]|uniref:hypothetical protein n=1 Tax=Allomuricauda sp. CP2A TaxID=1848189 RepID=UPI001C4004DE
SSVRLPDGQAVEMFLSAFRLRSRGQKQNIDTNYQGYWYNYEQSVFNLVFSTFATSLIKGKNQLEICSTKTSN